MDPQICFFSFYLFKLEIFLKLWLRVPLLSFKSGIITLSMFRSLNPCLQLGIVWLKWLYWNFLSIPRGSMDPSHNFWGLHLFINEVWKLVLLTSWHNNCQINIAMHEMLEKKRGPLKRKQAQFNFYQYLIILCWTLSLCYLKIIEKGENSLELVFFSWGYLTAIFNVNYSF